MNTRIRTETRPVTRDETFFITSDGREFSEGRTAQRHQTTLDRDAENRPVLERLFPGHTPEQITEAMGELRDHCHRWQFLHALDRKLHPEAYPEEIDHKADSYDEHLDEG